MAASISFVARPQRIAKRTRSQAPSDQISQGQFVKSPLRSPLVAVAPRHNRIDRSRNREKLNLRMPFDDSGNRTRVDLLRQRGVDVWGPERVYVSEDVDLDAIEAGAEIRQATLSGPELSIAAGATIGTSGHAEVDNCQIGRNVELGSGLYRGATFLEGVKFRGFAEVRPSTLLEEQAEAAHNVALKNTTFTSCCVAGSLINFCDLFLSGGRSRRDHTEIGSGAIHFNFDPRGHKWGSLIGGIRGVLLRSEPVFIGGNCGLVGPLEIGFGAVTTAGSVIRKDVAENTLVAESGRTIRIDGYDSKAYGQLQGSFMVTARLVGTLRALDGWYATVRIPHSSAGDRRLYEAARKQIDAQVQERIERLAKIVEDLPQGSSQLSRGLRANQEHRRLVAGWERFRRVLEDPLEAGEPPAAFVQRYAEARASDRGHVESVKSADAGAPQAERWLEGMVERVTSRARQALTSSWP